MIYSRGTGGLSFRVYHLSVFIWGVTMGKTEDVAVGTAVTGGAFESSVDDDESVLGEGGVRDQRFYAWHVLLEAIEGQPSTSDAGRRCVRDRVVALVRQADEAGLEQVDLMVEVADMAAALVMQMHDDPFAGLVMVHRMVDLRRAPGQTCRWCSGG